MLTDDVLKALDTSRAGLAKLLGIRRQAVYKWNGLVPQRWWGHLHALSEGRLTLPALPKARERRNGTRRPGAPSSSNRGVNRHGRV